MVMLKIFSIFLCEDQVQRWLDHFWGNETPWIDALHNRMKHPVLLGESDLDISDAVHMLFEHYDAFQHYYWKATSKWS